MHAFLLLFIQNVQMKFQAPSRINLSYRQIMQIMKNELEQNISFAYNCFYKSWCIRSFANGTTDIPLEQMAAIGFSKEKLTFNPSQVLHLFTSVSLLHSLKTNLWGNSSGKLILLLITHVIPHLLL